MDILQDELPVGPLLSVEEALKSEQSRHNNVHSEVTHPEYGSTDVLNLPIRMDSNRQEFETPPPLIGEHSTEILMELGFSESEIKKLESKNII
jgi:crotonobetainyl-CoA:carnitine CoA-transferase CaiB-like acyl-CoA transferase